VNTKSARRWIQIADRDVDVANLLPQEYADSSAHHYQQAAEKYLKGFLAAHQVPLRKSHSISTLLVQASWTRNSCLCPPKSIWT
jgi:HEPN domain-containing protein